MSTCPNCATKDHDPAACSNRGLPMIHRTCNCSCGRDQVDPAPYWTQQKDAR